MSGSFVYTLKSDLDVTVEYDAISDGEDVKITTVTPLGMPQCLAIVPDDEADDVETAALEDFYFHGEDAEDVA